MFLNIISNIYSIYCKILIFQGSYEGVKDSVFYVLTPASCKEIISGEKEWHGSYSDILLRFQKDAGEICTYWEAFDELRESGKFFEKIE